MFDVIYSLFFVVLLAEVFVFLFLTLPTPKGWKGKVVNFLNTSSSVQYLRKAHLGFCLIAALFLWDSTSNTAKFLENKNLARGGDSIAACNNIDTKK